MGEPDRTLATVIERCARDMPARTECPDRTGLPFASSFRDRVPRHSVARGQAQRFHHARWLPGRIAHRAARVVVVDRPGEAVALEGRLDRADVAAGGVVVGSLVDAPCADVYLAPSGDGVRALREARDTRVEQGDGEIGARELPRALVVGSELR